MEISAATVRLIVLFLPGLVVSELFHGLTPGGRRSVPELLAQGFGFGLLCYALLAGAAGLLDYCPRFTIPDITFFGAIIDGSPTVAWWEVFWATALGVPLAFALAALHNKKFIWWFGRRIGVTKLHGFQDVWGYVFDSPSVLWAIVRDHAHDLAYNGWIESYSDTVGEGAIFLRDVKVGRNSSGEVWYETNGLYLSIVPGQHTVEIVGLEGETGARNEERSGQQEQVGSGGDAQQIGSGGDNWQVGAGGYNQVDPSPE